MSQAESSKLSLKVNICFFLVILRLNLGSLLFSLTLLALLFFLPGNIYMASYAGDNTGSLEGVYQRVTEKNYYISGLVIAVD